MSSGALEWVSLVHFVHFVHLVHFIHIIVNVCECVYVRVCACLSLLALVVDAVDAHTLRRLSLHNGESHANLYPPPLLSCHTPNSNNATVSLCKCVRPHPTPNPPEHPPTSLPPSRSSGLTISRCDSHFVTVCERSSSVEPNRVEGLRVTLRLSSR